MKVVLVRHPPADVPPGICYGRLDLPLRPDAMAAAAALARRLGGMDLARIWTSPAVRCLGVAQAVVGVRLRVDERLRELDFGDWEGQAWNAVPRAALDAWAADPAGFAPPGGESGAALLARVRQVHAVILASGEDCAVIAHGGPLKLLSALLRGAPPDLLAPAPPLASLEIVTD